MGQEVHQDLALSIKVALALLSILENQWAEAEKQQQDDIAFLGSYVCITYGGCLQGNELSHADLHRLLKYAEILLEEGGQ